MMIDSLELDDDGRGRDRRAGARSEERAIVITHGTDTMVQDRPGACRCGARSARRSC